MDGKGERESTPDQTPGPSRTRSMEGGGTVRFHHQRQLGLSIYCARLETLSISGTEDTSQSRRFFSPPLHTPNKDTGSLVSILEGSTPLSSV